MNTGFLNWCKVLVGSRRRVLILAQTLGVVAVAAMFLASPLVVLAGGCGGNKQAVQVKPNKNITLLGTVLGVSKNLAPGTNVPNATVTLGGNPAGNAPINPNFTLKDLTPGTWIMATDNATHISFAGTIFSVSKVNGNTPVAEIWVADNASPEKVILKNVSLLGIPAA